MNTDTPERVTLIPIERIEVLNSRDRNAKVFEEIVENIQDIGLKKPITVTEREGLDSEPKYLLVCRLLFRGPLFTLFGSHSGLRSANAKYHGTFLVPLIVLESQFFLWL